MATAVASVAAAPAAQPEQVRVAFGELSRAVVALIASDRALAEGRFVFECPMAPGYRKWVQTSPTVSNPYMGQRMPGCGAPSTWQE